MKKPSKPKRARMSGGSGGARVMPICVLHIDDDPNDAELLQAATRRANVRFVLHQVVDGDQAIAYLSGQGIYADRGGFPLPSLILLDLKMPRATGFEILEWIRAHEEFKQVPVVILSGSELREDMRQAYRVGANSYFVKPLGFEALVGLVKNINSVWLSASRLRTAIH
jgi:CheY-like chemotaxis protein